MDINFRTAHLSDEKCAVPLIYSSGPQTFNYVFSVDYEQQSLDFLHFAYQQEQGQFSHKEHTLITADNQIVGCGSLIKNGSGLSNLWLFLKLIVSFYGIVKGLGVIYRGLTVEKVIPPPKDNVAYICNLGAHPQGKGYGSRLIEYFLKEAAECEITVAALDVADSNEQAKKLYQKMGFTIITHRNADKVKRWGKLEGHTYLEKTIL